MSECRYFLHFHFPFGSELGNCSRTSLGILVQRKACASALNRTHSHSFCCQSIQMCFVSDGKGHGDRFSATTLFSYQKLSGKTFLSTCFAPFLTCALQNGLILPCFLGIWKKELLKFRNYSKNNFFFFCIHRAKRVMLTHKFLVGRPYNDHTLIDSQQQSLVRGKSTFLQSHIL